jgi:uncharacterized NAD(P)/FAD-binding protein YdhS
MKRWVIAGGGYTGAATALHLARHSPQPLHIQLVEPRAQLGAGLAHSAEHPDLRLNGTPGIHAMYLDAPLHFLQWLQQNGTLVGDPQSTNPDGTIYPRRADFGRYMAAELARHAQSNASGSVIEHVRDRVARVQPSAGALRVELEQGSALQADELVLAAGWNAVAAPPQLAPLQSHAGWIGEPLNLARMAAIARDAPVLLVGAGLTAADAFAVLRAQGHQGPVTALSRRGLRPAAQTPHRLPMGVWQRLLDPNPDFVRRHGHPASVREALRALRQDLQGLRSDPTGWYVPFDELRDSITHFWPQWPDDEKRRALRHLKSRYDAFRFRNPPQTQRIVERGVASGQLSFASGRLESAQQLGDAMAVDWQTRDAGPRRLQAAVVVNCTGPQPRPSRSGNPLWRAMLGDGLARDHASGLGVDVDLGCRVVDQQGRAHANIRALGPITAGCFGEATAVPYIARQILQTLSPEVLQGRAAA